MVLALGAGAAFAGSTGGTGGTTHPQPLHMEQGGGSGSANGDFVATTLNSPYRYYIEVPTGVSRLVVELFDADVGAGTNEAQNQRDRARGGSFNTTFNYSLSNPGGTTVATLVGNSSGPGDNAWTTLYDSNVASGTAPAFGSISTATAGSNTTSITVARPSGTAIGDFLLLIVSKDDDAGGGVPSTPGGWTAVPGASGLCPSTGLPFFTPTCAVGVFYKIATVAEPATYTVNWTGSEEAVAAVLRYTGVSTAAPINASGADTGTSAAPTAPSVTTTVANTRIVRLYGADDDDLDGTPYPGGHTGRFNIESGTGNGTASAGGADTTQATAGGTGSAGFDLSATEQWRAVTIALAPATPSGSVPNGHWLVEVDGSGSGGDDINAFGLRAHDGTAGAGGTELPIYYESFAGFGVNPNSTTSIQNMQNYTTYPWVTAACTGNHNDFDYDSNDPANVGQVIYTTRTGAAGASIIDNSLSGDDVWSRATIPAWTTDASSVDYGLWTQATQVRTYGGANTFDNGNYVDTYFGTSATPANPPTTQPITTAFRAYLATDGQTKPVKPYLTQVISWVSGPNPPLVNQTSVFTVTVHMINPTARAITFSTSPDRQVRANVPGSGAVYGGNATVSQGSISSQPSVGGTGNVVWNPGSVAAGTTATLAYRVNVTPTSPGQRVVVTGTFASGNGTRAQYVDETANASQTRASYLFGPLCELAITQGAPTVALVSDVRVRSLGADRLVEWTTRSEVDTRSFDVWVQVPGSRAEKVNDEPLLAPMSAPEGAYYRFVDSSRISGPNVQYFLAEKEWRGESRVYGPYRVDTGALRSAGRRPSASFEATPRGADVVAAAAAAREPERASTKGTRPLAPALDLKADVFRGGSAQRIWGRSRGPAGAAFVHTREAGPVFLAASDLAANLGLDLGTVQSRIQTGQISITVGGAVVAWQPAAGGSGLSFYATASPTPFSRDNVYRVEASAGETLAASKNGGVPLSVGPAVTAARVEVEQDVLALTNFPLDPESDLWFWAGLQADHPNPTVTTKSFSFQAPFAAGGGWPGGYVTVRFYGATPVAHRAEISLNGTVLGDLSFSGQARYRGTVAFDASTLLPGTNTLTVHALGDGSGASGFFVDGFTVDYSRETRTADGRMDVTGTGEPLSVSGFTTNAIQVWNVDEPTRPISIEAVAVEWTGADYRATFNGVSRVHYLVFEDGAQWLPQSWTPDAPSDLRTPAHSADYLVIAAPELLAAAQGLADYRSAQGLESLVVSVQDVYDEFADGYPKPTAIRDFLAYAAEYWSRAPRYVVLAGAGNYDYTDALGLHQNVLPTLLALHEGKLFSHDEALAPAGMSIGRLPVHTPAELTGLIAKIAAYEAADPAWAARVLGVADDVDGSTSFTEDLGRVLGTVAGDYSTDTISLDSLSIPDANAALLTALSEGRGFVGYVGHGGVDVWAEGTPQEELFDGVDALALTNGDRPPLVAAFTCVNNRYEVPNFESLGSHLVRNPAGGAVAVWAPSNLAVNDHTVTLGTFFVQEALRGAGGSVRLGDAILAAEERYGDITESAFFNLLGDPALRIPQLPTPDGGPGGITGE